MILEAKDEQHLLEIAAKLEAHGILFSLIREPDAPFLNQATALGILPGPRERLRKLLSNLPLLR